MSGPPQRTSLESLSPDTSLSITHPPPSADSSTTDVLQRSFDTFNALISPDLADLTIGLDGLKRALQAVRAVVRRLLGAHRVCGRRALHHGHRRGRATASG